MSSQERLRTGIALEVLGPIAAVGVAIALTIDPRTTAIRITWMWAGVLLSALPLVLTAARMGPPTIAEWAAASLVGLTGIGASEIGGLAMLIPAGLLALAGTAHFIALSPRSLGNEAGRPHLVAGSLLLMLGAFLGLSFTPLAFLGWAILIASFITLAIGFRRRGRQRHRLAV